MKNLGLPEIIIIAAIFLFFFGGKKIPEMMRGLGRGMHEFKKASEGHHDDEPTATKTETK